MIGKRSKQNRAGLLNASFGAMLSMLVTFVGFMPPPVAAASYNPVPLTPRHGATATVLEDGTILIAGGKSGGTFVEAVEIYNPATGDISTVAGGISRTGHTATRLADGKVLVAGGSNDGSFEVYNGDIQVLKSGFNAKANALNSSNTIDEVLNAQTRASIIYDYPADSLPVDPASDIGDLLNRQDYAMAEVPQTGMNPPKILVAGGERGGVAVETAYVFDGSPAQITTGATDYAPGTPVKLNSSGWTGWQNNETVNLVLHKEKDGQASDIPLISLNVNDQGKLIGDRLLDSVTAWIAKHLKLRANVNKSGVGRPWNGKFLGFRMTRNGKVGPAKASLDKLKAEVRRHWNAQLSLKLEDRVIGWQRYIRGLVELLLSLRIPASHHHPGKLDASAHAQILLATLAQPPRPVARLAEVKGKAVPLETGQRLSRDMAFGAEPHAANRLEQRALATLGPVGAIRFCDPLSRQVQPPDAENRMSGGGGGVTGAIPLPPPDRCYMIICKVDSPPDNPP